MKIFFHTSDGTAHASFVPPAPGDGNADYFPLTSGFFAIMPAGATTTTIDIPLWDDNVVEQPETFNVTLTGTDYPGATFANTVATATILDDDVAPPPLPQLSVSQPEATPEGTAVVFNV